MSREGKVHVFYRTEDRSPFKYAGEATPHSFELITPVQITWAFQASAAQSTGASSAATDIASPSGVAHNKLQFPDEVSGTATYVEGAVKQVFVNAFERSAKAVADCKAYYGTSCIICGFDFGKVYGEIGRGYIHVHHLVQLADIAKDYKVDPIKDLRPVCPNCHSMLHQRRPPLSIDDLKRIIGRS